MAVVTYCAEAAIEGAELVLQPTFIASKALEVMLAS
jgi:hypothetical protein